MNRFLAGIVFTGLACIPAQSAEPTFPIPNYRTWVFLTSSLDLNYDEPVPGTTTRRSILDNVFVNPEAYQAFVKSGTWPDGTVMVKENRLAESAGELSKTGKFQTAVASIELHVKDGVRFPDKWAFFVSDGKIPGRYIPPGANCYTCHGDHGAVDTTFVQFYPTLLAIAKTKGTLSVNYRKPAHATP